MYMKEFLSTNIYNLSNNKGNKTLPKTPFCNTLYLFIFSLWIGINNNIDKIFSL